MNDSKKEESKSLIMKKKEEVKVLVIRSLLIILAGILGMTFAVISFNSNIINMPKEKMQLLAVFGFASFVGGVLSLLIAVIKNIRVNSNNRKVNSAHKDTVQYRYNEYVKSKPSYICNETTPRNPIEYDDKDYEKKSAEHVTYTEAFLKTVNYPKGFAEYIESNSPKKYIIKNRGKYGDYFEIYDIIPLEEIKEVTLNIMLGNDYHTQFRDLVIFAIDDGGHGSYMLDYGQDKANPSVKFLDNEVDLVEHVADSFDDFLANLVDEENPNMIEINRKMEEIIVGKKSS